MRKNLFLVWANKGFCHRAHNNNKTLNINNFKYEVPINYFVYILKFDRKE